MISDDDGCDILKNGGGDDVVEGRSGVSIRFFQKNNFSY